MKTRDAVGEGAIMRRRFVLPGAIILALATVRTAARCEEKPSPVLDALAERAAALAAPLPARPDSAAAWDRRRGEIVGQLAEVLGLPPREPMKAAVEFQREEGDLVVDEVVYHWAERTYGSGHVIRTKQASGRSPALVICPGYLGHYTWREYREFSEGMARAGWVVLFVEDPRVGKRHAADAGLCAVAAAAGMPLIGIQVFDALRGLDYLLTRVDVDSGRIGVVGVGPGARQACLAAALEGRFQFVVAVSGAGTFQSLARTIQRKQGSIPDPSVCAGGLVRVAEWDQIAACVAPRPLLVANSAQAPDWSPQGADRVSSTLKHVYGFLNAGNAMREIRDGRDCTISAFLPEIRDWAVGRAKSPASPPAALAAAGKPENPDFSMLRYLQGRIARQSAEFAKNVASRPQCEAYRERIVRWLDEFCDLRDLPMPAAKVGKASTADGLHVEMIELSLDGTLRSPALLFHPAKEGSEKQPAVVLSHDARQSAESPEVQQAVRALCAQGYWVLVPQHVSIHAKSPRRLNLADVPGYYAAAELAGLPPLALRVAENVAAVRYLLSRPEVASQQIVVDGKGLGAIDACLAALKEPRISGVVAANVTTLRDWAQSVAPEEIGFLDTLPYLPGMLKVTDFDYCIAALAPRPVVVARLKDGWPKPGFDQVVATASATYRVCGAPAAFMALGPRDVAEDRDKQIPAGASRLVFQVARAILPPPPVPGIVGPREGLRNRSVVDSASGLVWVVSALDGEEQGFCGGGYRLESWSFFNDNGPREHGRAITPLLFKKEGDLYRLTGSGATRTNVGSGLQTFPFDVVQGSDAVDAGFLFGFYTGDPAGKPNAGAVEYDDDPQGRMTILTLDGQMGDHKVALGQSYREQSHWPRAYSIQAVSKRK